MYQAIIPEDPRHPDPGDQVPPAPDPDEEIIDDPVWDDEPEIIDEPKPVEEPLRPSVPLDPAGPLDAAPLSGWAAFGFGV